MRLLAEGKTCRVVAMDGKSYVDYDIHEALSHEEGPGPADLHRHAGPHRRAVNKVRSGASHRKVGGGIILHELNKIKFLLRLERKRIMGTMTSVRSELLRAEIDIDDLDLDLARSVTISDVYSYMTISRVTGPRQQPRHRLRPGALRLGPKDCGHPLLL